MCKAVELVRLCLCQSHESIKQLAQRLRFIGRQPPHFSGGSALRASAEPLAVIVGVVPCRRSCRRLASETSIHTGPTTPLYSLVRNSLPSCRDVRLLG
jgi:hypothetical protein